MALRFTTLAFTPAFLRVMMGRLFLLLLTGGEEVEAAEEEDGVTIAVVE